MDYCGSQKQLNVYLYGALALVTRVLSISVFRTSLIAAHHDFYFPSIPPLVPLVLDTQPIVRARGNKLAGRSPSLRFGLSIRSETRRAYTRRTPDSRSIAKVPLCLPLFRIRGVSLINGMRYLYACSNRGSLPTKPDRCRASATFRPGQFSDKDSLLTIGAAECQAERSESEMSDRAMDENIYDWLVNIPMANTGPCPDCGSAMTKAKHIRSLCGLFPC